MMGCSPGDNECSANEKPPRSVAIQNGFWIGRTEVTVAAYKRFAQATVRDMPREPHVEWQDPPLATFVRTIFERPSVLMDGFFIAREGAHIVGLSYLLRRPDGDAEVGDTGVLASHRRRGIARVLKMLVTQYAVQGGIPYVHTDNRTDNAGMLTINRALGFVPADVIVIFERALAP